jgi:cell wall-associated NlpC family hydrolase
MALTTSRRLELLRPTSFKAEADGGENLELAMAVTIFKRLQDAGLIPVKAKLADDVPKLEGSKATSYEARLVELIKDTDGNGRLEIDLEALASAKVLTGATTALALEGTLSGRTTGTIPDAFITKQDSKSKLNLKGDDVKAYARGMVLTNEQDAAVINSFVARAKAEPVAVSREAVAAAQVLVVKGRSAEARALLETSGDALAAAGNFAEARAVFQTLTQAPHADVKRNLLQNEIDLTRTNHSFDEKTQTLQRKTSGNTLSLDTEAFASTVGATAKVRLEQLSVQERMSATLGRPVDPGAMKDAGAYFQAFSKGHDAKAVASEFQSYLQAFYKHAGEGVEWNAAIPQDARAGRLDELVGSQLQDESKRRVIDCEGFVYLSDRLLGGIENPDGSRRFQVEYATRPGHVIAGITEPATKQVFVVNNDKVSQPEFARDTHERIARALCGENMNIFGISTRQSESEPKVEVSNKYSPPRVGTFVWNGSAIVGEIDASQQSRYQDYANRTGLNASFGTWIRDEW